MSGARVERFILTEKDQKLERSNMAKIRVTVMQLDGTVVEVFSRWELAVAHVRGIYPDYGPCPEYGEPDYRGQNFFKDSDISAGKGLPETGHINLAERVINR